MSYEGTFGPEYSKSITTKFLSCFFSWIEGLISFRFSSERFEKLVVNEVVELFVVVLLFVLSGGGTTGDVNNKLPYWVSLWQNTKALLRASGDSYLLYNQSL